jgi:iron complex outermembrane receptor protein
MYEEEKWKIGLEAYYYSKQELNDNTIQRLLDFLVMIENFGKIFRSIYNFENFTDTKANKIWKYYTGPLTNPG